MIKYEISCHDIKPVRVNERLHFEIKFKLEIEITFPKFVLQFVQSTILLCS